MCHGLTTLDVSAMVSVASKFLQGKFASHIPNWFEFSSPFPMLVAKEPGLPCYLNHSWGAEEEEMDSYVFQRYLCESECNDLGWNLNFACQFHFFHANNCYATHTSNNGLASRK